MNTWNSVELTEEVVKRLLQAALRRPGSPYERRLAMAEAERIITEQIEVISADLENYHLDEALS